MRLPRVPLTLVALLCGCSFRARTDTVADDLLRYAGSYEVLRSDARGEVLYVDTLRAGPSETFRHLIDAYLEVGLPPARTDDANRVVAGHVARLGRIAGEEATHWLDCHSGTAERATNPPREMSLWFASRIDPVSGGSAILSVLRADVVAPSVDAAPCFSRGTLEALLAEMVRADLD